MHLLAEIISLLHCISRCANFLVQMGQIDFLRKFSYLGCVVVIFTLPRRLICTIRFEERREFELLNAVAS